MSPDRRAGAGLPPAPRRRLLQETTALQEKLLAEYGHLPELRIDQARGCPEDDLIVHRSAAKRVRMTGKRNTFRGSGRLFQDPFKPAVWSGDKQITFRIHS